MNPRNSETAIETKHKREIEELILELHQAGSILSLKIQQRFELRYQVFFKFICRKYRISKKYFYEVFLLKFRIFSNYRQDQLRYVSKLMHRILILIGSDR